MTNLTSPEIAHQRVLFLAKSIGCNAVDQFQDDNHLNHLTNVSEDQWQAILAYGNFCMSAGTINGLRRAKVTTEVCEERVKGLLEALGIHHNDPVATNRCRLLSQLTNEQWQAFTEYTSAACDQAWDEGYRNS